MYGAVNSYYVLYMTLNDRPERQNQPMRITTHKHQKIEAPINTYTHTNKQTNKHTNTILH